MRLCTWAGLSACGEVVLTYVEVCMCGGVFAYVEVCM